MTRDDGAIGAKPLPRTPELGEFVSGFARARRA